MKRIAALLGNYARQPGRLPGLLAAAAGGLRRPGLSGVVPDASRLPASGASRHSVLRVGTVPATARPARDRASGTVLVVVHDLGIGGAQEVALQFADWLLRETGHGVKFVAMRDGPQRPRFEAVAELFCIGRNWGGERRALRRRLERWAGPDVRGILVNSVASGGFYALWRRDVPSIAFIHELEQILDRHRPAFARILARADRIVAGSGAVRDVLARQPGLRPDRLVQAYPFIEPARVDPGGRAAMRAALGAGPLDFLVCGCGVLHWRKSPDVFLDVAARLGGGPQGNLRFVWIGGGPDGKRCRQRIRRERLERVSITGFLPDVTGALHAADLFLLPSQEDAFPLSALHAAEAGVPVICFRDAGGMPEFVARGCGLALPFGDSAAMARAVLDYAADPERRAREGAAGRQAVAEEFVVDRGAPGLYAHLLAEMHPPRRRNPVGLAAE